MKTHLPLSTAAKPAVDPSAVTIDPVCGMTVDPSKTTWKYEEGGASYAFCCERCLDKFVAQRAAVAGRAPEAPGPPSAARLWTCPMHAEVRQEKPGACPKCGMALEPLAPVPTTKRTEWTCPMHPEIVRDHPGACPICGMALEPRAASAEEEENPELRDMTRRFWFSVALTSALLTVAMSDLLPGEPRWWWMSGRARTFVELASRDAGLYSGRLGRSSFARPSR